MPTKTLADWTADVDEDDAIGNYIAEKRQRGGRKKRKKNKQDDLVLQNWDDIYDPSRPNAFDDYKNSDERVLEVQEWKDRLYAHRSTQNHRLDSDSDSDAAARPAFNRKSIDVLYSCETEVNIERFAPPVEYSSFTSPVNQSTLLPDKSSSLQRPDDPSVNASGEDAYWRRMNMSPQVSSHANIPIITSESPLPSDAQSNLTISHAISNPPKPTPSEFPIPKPNINREPVRYELPPAPVDIPASEAELAQALRDEEDAINSPSDDQDDARTIRPGQKGFAERLMSKYGWTKGSGLGARGSGMLAPLRVQVEKQKKKPDSEGGGHVGPGGMGKIIAGKRKGGSAAQQGKFGAMSEVIILRGMLNGMDLDHELGSGDGGLMQEIGEECGEKVNSAEHNFYYYIY